MSESHPILCVHYAGNHFPLRGLVAKHLAISKHTWKFVYRNAHEKCINAIPFPWIISSAHILTHIHMSWCDICKIWSRNLFQLFSVLPHVPFLQITLRELLSPNFLPHVHPKHNEIISSPPGKDLDFVLQILLVHCRHHLFSWMCIRYFANYPVP